MCCFPPGVFAVPMPPDKTNEEPENPNQLQHLQKIIAWQSRQIAILQKGARDEDKAEEAAKGPEDTEGAASSVSGSEAVDPCTDVSSRASEEASIETGREQEDEASSPKNFCSGLEVSSSRLFSFLLCPV